MLVCEDICVVFLFTGDMCLEVRVVWSSVFFSGGCCMEWCFLLRWVVYGVVFSSPELYS